MIGNYYLKVYDERSEKDSQFRCFHLIYLFIIISFVCRLKVLLWESIMVAVKRIAGMMTTVTHIISPVLVIIS